MVREQLFPKTDLQSLEIPMIMYIIAIRSCKIHILIVIIHLEIGMITFEFKLIPLVESDTFNNSKFLNEI